MKLGVKIPRFTNSNINNIHSFSSLVLRRKLQQGNLSIIWAANNSGLEGFISEFKINTFLEQNYKSYVIYKGNVNKKTHFKNGINHKDETKVNDLTNRVVVCWSSHKEWNKIFKINLLKSLDIYESTHTRRNSALTNKDSKRDFFSWGHKNECLISLNRQRPAKK